MNFFYLGHDLAVFQSEIKHQPPQILAAHNFVSGNFVYRSPAIVDIKNPPYADSWGSIWQMVSNTFSDLKKAFASGLRLLFNRPQEAGNVSKMSPSSEVLSDTPPFSSQETEQGSISPIIAPLMTPVTPSKDQSEVKSVGKSQEKTIDLVESSNIKPRQVQRKITISPDVQNLHLASVEILNQEPSIDAESFQPEIGVRFNDDSSVTLRVLVGNDRDRLTVIGDFNQWGAVDNIQAYELQPTVDNPHIHQVILPSGNNYHKAQYRLRDQNGHDRLDMGATLFATATFNERFYDYPRRADLNAVMWKFTPLDPTTVYPSPDLRGKQLVIAETDIVSLALKWTCQNHDSPYYGDVGAKHISNLYQFVGDCGLPEQLADMGYNAIQFMPLDTHVDFWEPKANYFPDWRYSYQVLNFYGKHADFGSPDELRAMLNALHKTNLAVVLDVVYSHFSPNGNNPPREFEPLGFSQYHDENGQELYGQNWTRWGTRRFNYTPEIRKNIIDAALVNILTYGFDGLRLDNVNGIEKQPYGRQLLRNLTQAVKAYRPQAVVIGEAYFGDPDLNRITDVGGAGLLTTYSDRFYLWFTEDLIKYRNEVDTWKLDYMLNQDWTRALLYYPGNHDEFANPGNPFQTRGRYLVEAIQGGDEHNLKIRSWSALNLFASSFYLDMPQLWTLQGGNLNDNSPIDWQQLQYPTVNQLVQFQGDMKKFFTSEVAFAPYNLHSHMVRWIDHLNKIVVFERIDFSRGRRVYVVVNLGDKSFEHYKIGVAPEISRLEVKVDSDLAKYSGGDRNPSIIGPNNNEVEIYLGSYGVVALAEPEKDLSARDLILPEPSLIEPDFTDLESFGQGDAGLNWGY